jgi:rRNA biogenesis protein RRP5
VKIILSFSLLEFKKGTPERGRTLFEGLLSNYPKRVDIWSVYLDQEIRLGDLVIVRRLFERAIKLDRSTKKMKFLFKKYLLFENEYGTEETQNHVKDEAMKYVERVSGESLE